MSFRTRQPNTRRRALSTAIACGLGAVLTTGIARADYQPDAGTPENVVRYQVDVDRAQIEIDRKQADLDRRQADLDRRKHRFRQTLEDASWRFGQLDADEDLRVSRTEAQTMPAVARMFGSLDDDGNGELTEREFQDFAVSRLQGMGQ